jgi:hypothetical protein
MTRDEGLAILNRNGYTARATPEWGKPLPDGTRDAVYIECTEIKGGSGASWADFYATCETDADLLDAASRWAHLRSGIGEWTQACRQHAVQGSPDPYSP